MHRRTLGWYFATSYVEVKSYGDNEFHTSIKQSLEWVNRFILKANNCPIAPTQLLHSTGFRSPAPLNRRSYFNTGSQLSRSTGYRIPEALTVPWNPSRSSDCHDTRLLQLIHRCPESPAIFQHGFPVKPKHGSWCLSFCSPTTGGLGQPGYDLDQWWNPKTPRPMNLQTLMRPDLFCKAFAGW